MYSESSGLFVLCKDIKLFLYSSPDFSFFLLLGMCVRVRVRVRVRVKESYACVRYN